VVEQTVYSTSKDCWTFDGSTSLIIQVAHLFDYPLATLTPISVVLPPGSTTIWEPGEKIYRKPWRRREEGISDAALLYAKCPPRTFTRCYPPAGLLSHGGVRSDTRGLLVKGDEPTSPQATPHTLRHYPRSGFRLSGSAGSKTATFTRMPFPLRSNRSWEVWTQARGVCRFHGLVVLSLRRAPPPVIARVEEKRKKKKRKVGRYGLVLCWGIGTKLTANPIQQYTSEGVFEIPIAVISKRGPRMKLTHVRTRV
jgi:hypothetical protein